MIESLQTQIDKLRDSLAALEAQRAILGDAVVDTAVGALRQQLAALEAEQQVQAAPTEERRVITILFTDVVGSTALAEKLDPEEWREIVAGAHQRVSEAVYRYEGTIAQLLG